MNKLSDDWVKNYGQMFSCTHPDILEDTIETERGGLGHWPESNTDAIEVCQKCVSWRYLGEEKWRGAYE